MEPFRWTGGSLPKDGNYVAYGTSANGSELSTLYLIETATGELLQERIEAGNGEVVHYSDHYAEKGLDLFEAAKQRGLEGVLAKWGVTVGRNVVRDEKNSTSPSLADLVTLTFSSHPLMRPVFGSQLFFVLPRSVRKSDNAPAGAGAPQVDPLVYTGPEGRVITDLRPDRVINPTDGDLRGNVPLIVAVERGGIRNVSADRGATRLVVTGESLFLDNNNIDREGNREFAAYAVNWLLARDELLVNVPPRPIWDYKLNMTKSQMTGARWILMAVMPGSVLVLGALVWLRRRR